ncbi:MAG: cation-transporting P-type ATPase, partial [Pseudomonadota bacterium]
MGDEDLRLQPEESAWHQLPAEEVARRLRTDLQAGLTGDEVRQRRERYGANEIREGRRRGPFAMFLGQFTDFMILVLIGAA